MTPMPRMTVGRDGKAISCWLLERLSDQKPIAKLNTQQPQSLGHIVFDRPASQFGTVMQPCFT